MELTIKETDELLKIIEKAVAEEIKKTGLLRFLRETAERQTRREVKKILNSYDVIESMSGRLRKIETKFNCHIAPTFEQINKGEIREIIMDVFHSWQKSHTPIEDRLINANTRLTRLETKVFQK